MSWLVMMYTLRKNKPPAGSIMRCEPVSVFSSRPSLNHWMVGVGLPSAWQLNVNGSFFGTVVSMGCSMIRGFSPGTERGRNGFLILFLLFLSCVCVWWCKVTLHRVGHSSGVLFSTSRGAEKDHMWEIILEGLPLSSNEIHLWRLNKFCHLMQRQLRGH